MRVCRAVLILLLVSACREPTHPPPPPPLPTGLVPINPELVELVEPGVLLAPDLILVVVSAQMSLEGLRGLAAQVNAEVVSVLPTAQNGGIALYQVELRSASREALTQALAVLRSDARIIAAFELLLVEPTSPLDNDQLRAADPAKVWAYDAIQVSEAWQLLENADREPRTVRIGIIDTGLNSEHSEFKGKVPTTGENFLPGEDPRDWTDHHDHGTMIAGIIGASNDGQEFNGVLGPSYPDYEFKIYRVGLYWDSRLDKFLDSLNPCSSGMLNTHAVMLALANAAFDGLDVLNLSFKVPFADPEGRESWKDFLSTVLAKSVKTVVIAAAGNDNEDASDNWPLRNSHERFLIVGGTDKANMRWRDQICGRTYGSGWGDLAIAAPAKDVWTTRATGGYRNCSGTSCAAPLVTGVVGLLLQLGVAANDVKRLLVETGDPIDTDLPIGKLVNAHRAVAAALSVPSDIILVGDAKFEGDGVRLTAASEWQTGAAWFADKKDVQDGFTVSFSFEITDPGGVTDALGNTGGDGMAFVIQDESRPALGSQGAGQGYAGITRSVAIEFDTFFGDSDPDGNHISVQTRGSTGNSENHQYSLGAVSAPVDLSDGSRYSVTVYYTPGLLTVALDNQAVLSTSLDLTSVAGDNILDGNGEAWVGFTAATGAAYQNHVVFDWSFSPIDESIIPAPSNLEITGVSNTHIDLNWQDNSNNETEFRLERKTSSASTWAEIAIVGSNTTNYSDSGLSPSTTYDYRVRACNAAGCSNYSNEVSATTTGNGATGQIAFTSDRDGNSEIYLVNVDGSAATNVTNNAGLDQVPTWSPDGSKIAFGTDRDGNNEIYVMESDGSNLINLSNHPGDDAVYTTSRPAWSSDGTRIAFYSLRDGNPEIYLVNSDGTGLFRLTNHPGEDYRPTWSPDGTKIAFDRAYSGDVEIYAVNVDGSGLVNLTNSPSTTDVFAEWSPDGSKIAFTRILADGNSEIYTMNPDGSGQTNLTNHPSGDLIPMWSPDGSRIAFRGFRDGSADIYVMNAAGGGLVNLSQNAASDWDYAWSPDGSRIAFSTDRDGNWEIYVMNAADGSGLRNLSNNSAKDEQPAWRP